MSKPAREFWITHSYDSTFEVFFSLKEAEEARWADSEIIHVIEKLPIPQALGEWIHEKAKEHALPNSMEIGEHRYYAFKAGATEMAELMQGKMFEVQSEATQKLHDKDSEIAKLTAMMKVAEGTVRVLNKDKYIKFSEMETVYRTVYGFTQDALLEIEKLRGKVE